MLQRVLIIATIACGIAAAQDPPSRAGRISYVSGSVSFEPAGVSDWAAATLNRPLTMGDQLYADNGARAEVHVPGTAFRLGDRTAFEFMNLDDRTVQVRLSEGMLDVRVRRLDGNIEIDTPNVAFTVARPGEYRIDTNPDNGQTLITARDGQGQVMAGGGSFTLQMGQQAVIIGQDQNAQYKVNPAPGFDTFDRWVMSRTERTDRYAQSTYVSPDMVGYEDLGEYGTWRSTPDYGQVWVPNGVSSGWAPYSDGDWAWVEPWGWTWVDAEPWGFAPFHYGRWAHINGYWGWCPGPVVAPVYAPALVAWVGFGAGVGFSVGAGPGVGWFPLGPRDVYIPAFTASEAFVTRVNVSNSRIINTTVVNNVYGGYMRTHSVPVTSYMNRSVPGAVMAMPQSALAGGRPVHGTAVRIQPNQLASVHAVDAAPHVAPQMASVLGHAPGKNVARPPAGVLSRPVVARTAPPAPPASFQQRQALLARDPGHPVSMAQMHQLSSSAPAARPPVRVMNNTHPVTPQMAHGSTPANVPPAAQPRTQPIERPVAPPVAQQHNNPAPARQPQPQHQPAPQPRIQAHQNPPPAARLQPRHQAPPQPRIQAHQNPRAARPQPQPRAAQPAPRVQAQQHRQAPPEADRQIQHPAPRPQPQVQHQAPPRPQPQHQAPPPHPEPEKHH